MTLQFSTCIPVPAHMTNNDSFVLFVQPHIGRCVSNADGSITDKCIANYTCNMSSRECTVCLNFDER